MKKHHWTEEEKAIVRRDYKGTNESATLIAQNIGVSFYAVKGQTQSLGLSKILDTQKPPDWSPEEIEILREYYNQLCPQRLKLKLPGRTITAIVIKGKRLGLSRRFRDGWYTKMEAAEILGVDHKWIQRRIDSGELKASWHGELKPQNEGMAMWHIDEADLRQFIIEHCDYLTGRNVDLFTTVHLLVD